MENLVLIDPSPSITSTRAANCQMTPSLSAAVRDTPHDPAPPLGTFPVPRVGDVFHAHEPPPEVVESVHPVEVRLMSS
jgi:hypothetical protein